MLNDILLMYEHVPNIKYKTELCRYWEEGMRANSQADSAKREWAAFLPTANKNCGPSNR